MIHISMCLRLLRDALVSQVEYFRLQRSRATASEMALVRAIAMIQNVVSRRDPHRRFITFSISRCRDAARQVCNV